MSEKRIPRPDAPRPPHPSMTKARHHVGLVVGALALAAGIGATVYFWLGGTGEPPRAYALAPESALPANVRRAPPSVREAYRFAVANRETLRWIPCFCGCGTEGHKSNADCYVKDIRPDGSIIFDFMSLG